MPLPDTIGAFAIVLSNNLKTAIPFWEHLGFARTVGDANYVIITGWDCEVHLTQAGAGLWPVPEANNPLVFSFARPTLTPSPRAWTT
jgi:hypothetical protein